MGRFFDRRPPRHDRPTMKTLFAALAIFFALPAFAFKAPISPGPGMSATLGGWSTASNYTGTFNAAATAVTGAVSVSGATATLAGSASLAATAGNVAASALKLNPAGLLTSAVASWALSAGLQYLNGQWQKNNAPSGYVAGYMWCYNGAPNCGPTPDAALQFFKNIQPNYPNCSVSSSGTTYVNYSCSSPTLGTLYPTVNRAAETCPAGTYRNGTQCVGLVVPATDPDFAALAAKPLTDAAATDLAKAGAKLPLNKPTFAPMDLPVGSPYVDPVTGKRYQDMVRLTPGSDGTTVEAQMYKQEVNADGTTATDSTTGQPASPEKGETQTDCDKKPESIGCSDWGEPDDTDIQKNNKTFSLTPDGGWGAATASCPADRTYSLKSGGVARFSYSGLCQGAELFRPLIIGMAWLSAILIAIGLHRKYQ